MEPLIREASECVRLMGMQAQWCSRTVTVPPGSAELAVPGRARLAEVGHSAELGRREVQLGLDGSGAGCDQ